MQVDTGIPAGGIHFAGCFHGFKDSPVLIGRKGIERMPEIGAAAERSAHEHCE
jgi:hypothetical protein